MIGICLALIILLSIVSIIDIRSYRISNTSCLVLAFIGVLYSNYVKQSWIECMLGVVSISVPLITVRLLLRKNFIGGGDIKFTFVIGFVLGFRLGLCALILSTFLALPYSCAALMLKKNNEVPYGPFLAASLFVVFLFSEKFMSLLNLIFISL